ncbi:hypothetical protein DL769_001402 [Monosporascus sp. CRB-8-3]|nr:hypothetical protein DL769_001402 [Monosporascus sp. CRB-8-3]
MSSQINSVLQAPFRPGDSWNLAVPDMKYYPDHPLMKQLNEACTRDTLDEVKRLVTEWQDMREPSPPRGPNHYPLGTLEPVLYHAIRENRADVVAYLLQQGIKMSRLAVTEALSHKSTGPMWQVFLEHGLDINAPLADSDGPPLTYVLQDESLVGWFLANGADPNAESRNGLSPFLRAVSEAPLATVQLLHAAGGSPNLAVPFACSPLPGVPRTSNEDGSETRRRLAVLRFLLDAGADPDSRKWAHSSRGRASDFDWGSGLNLALVNGFDDLAEELLRRGARTDVQTFNIASRGETALELARRYVPRLVPMVEECRRRELATQQR